MSKSDVEIVISKLIMQNNYSKQSLKVYETKIPVK